VVAAPNPFCPAAAAAAPIYKVVAKAIAVNGKQDTVPNALHWI
jgi:hypothetical protein